MNHDTVNHLLCGAAWVFTRNRIHKQTCNKSVCWHPLRARAPATMRRKLKESFVIAGRFGHQIAANLPFACLRFSVVPRGPKEVGPWSRVCTSHGGAQHFPHIVSGKMFSRGQRRTARGKCTCPAEARPILNYTV